jgi:hypothetical protein
MLRYLKYFSYLIVHKYYMLLECYERGILWRGIVHDVSKFRPSEFKKYANYFFGPSYQTTINNFHLAHAAHVGRNDHHWQWWVVYSDAGLKYVLEMSEGALNEMLADWAVVGHRIGVSVDEWYSVRKDMLLLHRNTRNKLEDKIKAS